MSDTIVRPGIPEIDDCKILTRLKAFLVDQGVCATLEHQLTATGTPIGGFQFKFHCYLYSVRETV